MKAFVSGFFGLILVGCGSGQGSGGSVKISLSSSALALRTSGLRAACSVTVDSTTTNGKCYTPTRVSGFFNAASFGSTSGGAPVRLLGGGSASGLAAVFKKTAFDLKTSPTISSSEDNIEDGGGSYNIVTLSVQGIETEFVAEASSKVYRVRIPFAATPPSSSTVFSSCGLGGGLADADSLGTLYGAVNAQAGDILVCIKNSVSDACTDSEFQWVDGSTLTSTRTGTVKKLSGTYLKTNDACASGATNPSVTWGYANLDVLLSSAVAVSAARSGNSKTYTVAGTSGTRLNVNLDIGLSESLFVPDTAFTTDLNATTQATILSNIDKVLFKPVYIKNNKTTASSGTGDLTASATLSVSP